jgi:hypothetical protein
VEANLKKIILIAALAVLPLRADDARGLHDFAHVSGGALAGFGAYGAWKALMRPKDRATAIVFGVLTGLMACGIKEMHDAPKRTDSLRDFGYCAVGTGAATATILTFDF